MVLVNRIGSRQGAKISKFFILPNTSWTHKLTSTLSLYQKPLIISPLPSREILFQENHPITY